MLPGSLGLYMAKGSPDSRERALALRGSVAWQDRVVPALGRGLLMGWLVLMSFTQNRKLPKNKSSKLIYYT